MATDCKKEGGDMGGKSMTPQSGSGRDVQRGVLMSGPNCNSVERVLEYFSNADIQYSTGKSGCQEFFSQKIYHQNRPWDGLFLEKTSKTARVAGTYIKATFF
jgi:hypothetical protein